MENDWGMIKWSRDWTLVRFNMKRYISMGIGYNDWSNMVAGNIKIKHMLIKLVFGEQDCWCYVLNVIM
ncbi:hypothetical protein [Candidatus Hodgkinia cicadicola]|uniref:hypothetical protein n=1 Tax=Candidatus Hodgkinia cicadicola TaxID=573658 RepID=UPI0011BA7A06